MERFRQLGGVVLLKDPSDESLEFDQPVHLTGGRNMLKRALRGYRRRPGMGALSVSGGAAVTTGSSPKGAFPATFSGAGDEVLAIDGGVLVEYDRADSFDQLTKSLTNARPTYGVLGGYHLFATGGRPMKYDGANAPSPLGSKLITDFENITSWTGDMTADTDNEMSGTQCIKLTGTAAQVVTAEKSTDTQSSITGSLMFTYGTTGLVTGNIQKYASKWPEGALNGRTVSAVRFSHRRVTGQTARTELLTVSLQYEGVDGLPDGNDIGAQTFDWTANDVVNTTYHDTVTFGTPVEVANNGKAVYIVFTPNPSELGITNIWAGLGAVDTTRWKKYGSDAWEYGGAYDLALIVYHTPTAASVLDLYTGYPNSSQIVMNLHKLDADSVTEGVNSFIRFKTDDDNYFEYRILNLDCGTGQFNTVLKVRGDRYGVGGEFSVAGAPDWASISEILISVEITDNGDYVLFDQFYLLHLWAPPASAELFVADGRAFVVVGNVVYYSEKWAPNTFYRDTYLVFPTDVVSVVQAGPNVIFLTERDAWRGIPLSSFPDYKIDSLDQYGCVAPAAACVATVAGKKGAAWVTRNRGVRFWDGIEPPAFISEPIREIFTDYKENSQHFDFSRDDEVILLYHPRWGELWMFYPTLLTGETNLKYAWVLQCESLDWMPLFEWGGDNNLVFASVYRDTNDGLYKLLLTDSSGAVWHEGFVGTTKLSDTTSKDGYVDGSTTGAMVKGYVEIPFVGGWRGDRKNKDQDWHEINFKYLPGTTSEFILDLDYKVAAKGTGVDKDTYPNEEEVLFGDAWTSFGETTRSTTQTDVDNVVERNAKLGADVDGHALAIRIGQVDTGGAVEWELYGVYPRGTARGGNR